MRTVFSQKIDFKLSYFIILSSEEMITTVNKLVHFGWKKEAIPIAHSKKSLIARFFEAILINYCFFRNISCFKELFKLVYNVHHGFNLSKTLSKKVNLKVWAYTFW